MNHEHEIDHEAQEQLAHDVCSAAGDMIRNLIRERGLCAGCSSAAITAGLLGVIADLAVSIGECRSPTETRKFAGHIEKRLHRQINFVRENSRESGGSSREAMN